MRFLIVLSLLLYSENAYGFYIRVAGLQRNGTGSASPGNSSMNASVFLKQQYHNPAETFSVLLLIGGDSVQKAIAQLAGHQRFGYDITPAAFSFGWVAYAFNVLNSALSDGTLMPPPDIVCRVINLSSGGARDNESWVIGRLVRDLELSRSLALTDRLPAFTFLTTEGEPGRPQADVVWWSFALFLPLQLAVAAIPVALPQHNWAILMITAIGSLLAILTGSFPQWTMQKYACRKDAKDTYVLTRGNGHQHIFVIEDGNSNVRGNNSTDKGTTSGGSLNLEDLAIQSPKSTHFARLMLAVLATLWVFFLITAGGIDQDSWYLLAVGGLGMVHNLFAANIRRSPAAHGIPLKQKRLEEAERIMAEGSDRTMAVLKKAEEARPGLGLAVLKTFFPGRLRKDEAEEWEHARNTLETRQKAFKYGHEQKRNPWSKHGDEQGLKLIDEAPTQRTIQRSFTVPSSSI